jgi:hypothetical protein
MLIMAQPTSIINAIVAANKKRTFDDVIKDLKDFEKDANVSKQQKICVKKMLECVKKCSQCDNTIPDNHTLCEQCFACIRKKYEIIKCKGCNNVAIRNIMVVCENCFTRQSNLMNVSLPN